MDVSGKRVVVTGASRGIGAVIAQRFAAAGADVALVARNRELLEKVAADLPRATVHPCDLADPDAVDGLLPRIEAEGGPVSVLVNNAGIETHANMATISREEVRAVIEVNLQTPIELCRQALPLMLGRGEGHIVNVASLFAVVNAPGVAPYCTSKAGLAHFTASLRADLRGRPVGTTLVQIGTVPTDMLAAIDEYEPVRRSFERLEKLRLSVDISAETVADGIVSAVQRNKRHVVLPARGLLYAKLAEAPRRISEILLTGVPHQ